MYIFALISWGWIIVGGKYVANVCGNDSYLLQICCGWFYLQPFN